MQQKIEDAETELSIKSAGTVSPHEEEENKAIAKRIKDCQGKKAQMEEQKDLAATADKESRTALVKLMANIEGHLRKQAALLRDQEEIQEKLKEARTRVKEAKKAIPEEGKTKDQEGKRRDKKQDKKDKDKARDTHPKSGAENYDSLANVEGRAQDNKKDKDAIRTLQENTEGLISKAASEGKGEDVETQRRVQNLLLERIKRLEEIVVKKGKQENARDAAMRSMRLRQAGNEISRAADRKSRWAGHELTRERR